MIKVFQVAEWISVMPETNRICETTVRNCPACRTVDGKAFGHKGHYDLLTCNTCGTMYTSIVPEAENSEDYDTYYTESNLSAPDFIHLRLDQIVAQFSPYRRTNRLLDIGCGAGSLLKAAGRAGWQAEGLDISKTAIDHVRASGFPAFLGQLSDANYPGAHFDVVTASELMEHVPDPESLVAEIARILRPGGLWWATTPHATGLSSQLLGLKWSVISPPEHLHLFSINGIKILLLNHGFHSVRIRTEGVNPAELLQAARVWKKAETANFAGADRVRTGYQLNETFSSSSSLRAIKHVANGILRLGRLGDSLKIWAER